MLKEFREFALKGNVVDLAVGVIIGAAFSKIVDSLVGDIIMPVIGAITGGLDFSNYFFMLTGMRPSGDASLEAARKAGAVVAYGSFLTIVVNFAIVAFVLFLVIKAMNQLKRRQSAAVEASAPAPVPPDVQLLTEIRDILGRRPA